MQAMIRVDKDTPYRHSSTAYQTAANASRENRCKHPIFCADAARRHPSRLGTCIFEETPNSQPAMSQLFCGRAQIPSQTSQSRSGGHRIT